MNEEIVLLKAIREELVRTTTAIKELAGTVRQATQEHVSAIRREGDKQRAADRGWGG